MQIFDPRFANPENTLIDCLVQFEGMEEAIPFTASPNDRTDQGQEIYALLLTGPIAPFFQPVGQVRAAKEGAIRAEGARRLSALATPYLPAERETWATQQREAREWLASPVSPTPMLSAIAANRGITLADLVGKVMENVTAFESASGAILGEQQALLDTLAAVDPAAPDAAAQIAAVQWVA